MIVAGIVAALAVAAVGGFFVMRAVLPTFLSFTFVNEAAFPDRNLRAWVADKVDGDGNGVLTPDEVAAVTQLNLRDPAATTYEPQPVATDAEQAFRYAAAGVQGEVIGRAHAEKAGSQAEGSSASSGDAPALQVESLAGIQYLSHLKSLVCPDAGLAELDVSGLPSLEYVDCRGNRFTALDLSQNASLVCLYCDTDVTVAGLDQAGLVCDDLLVKATSTGVGDGGSLVQMTFAYDAYGRLVQGDGKLYGYDELGRLSAVHTPERQDCNGTIPAFTDEYRYDDQGNVTTSIRHEARYSGSDVFSVVPFETVLEYDDKGQLAHRDSTVPTHLGFHPANIVVADYQHNDKGGLASASLSRKSSYNLGFGSLDSMSEVTYRYTDEGALAGYESENVFESDRSVEATTFDATGSQLKITSSYDGVADEDVEATMYDERGFPVRTIDGQGVRTIAYTCNGDGYITRARWHQAGSEDARGSYKELLNRTVTLDYVKHVGSAAYRDGQRFLPTYAFTSLRDYDYFDCRWQPSNGVAYVVSLVELDPVTKTYQREGLVAATVYSGMRFPTDASVLGDAGSAAGEGGWGAAWPWRDYPCWIASGEGGAANEPDGGVANPDGSDPDGADATGSSGAQDAADGSDDSDASGAADLTGGYVLPESDVRLYTHDELAELTVWELFVARNEIFARHGRGFSNQDLAAHFASCPWYDARYTPEEFDAMPSLLNEYERQNAEAIRVVEEEKGSPYLS